MMTTTTPRRDARGRFAPAPQARYAAICARLDATRRRVLTWDAQRELLHPHDAAEDADWPAPTNYSEVRDLLRRLPIRARVLCAYVAAEMALPIWEQRDGRGAPRRALALMRHWLDGDPVSESELREAVDAAYATYENAGCGAAYATAAAAYSAANAAAANAANAASAAAAYAAYADIATAAAYSAANATATTAYAGAATYKFYIRWWTLCRSRLSIASIETAELETA